MANIHTVFDAIIDNGTTGEQVEIPFDSKNDYETLRTQLVKLWSKRKSLITAIAGEDSDPLLAFSLCSNWKKDEKIGTFFLGKPRKKIGKEYSFTIVTPISQPIAVNDE